MLAECYTTENINFLFMKEMRDMGMDRLDSALYI